MGKCIKVAKAQKSKSVIQKETHNKQIKDGREQGTGEKHSSFY